MASRGHRDQEQMTAALADDFSEYLLKAKADPEFRAAFEDAQERHKTIDGLVGCRRALRLSQTEVARRMGVRQPTVSGFETEHSDPRLSTLQRYARAVEARLIMRIEMPATVDWVCRATSYSPAENVVRVGAATMAASPSGIVEDWEPLPAMSPAA